MIRFLLIFTAFILSTAFVVRSQSADVVAGCVPLSVAFTAPGGSSTYFWDFKDGATSTSANPSNTFTTPGTYVVSFKESVGGPELGTVSIQVFVAPVPTLTATSPLKGCAPLTVNLQMGATTPPGIIVNGYNWAMGNGVGLNTQNVTYTYPTVGVFDITCQISTNYPSCNSDSTFNDFVSTSNPSCNFFTSPNPASACSAPFDVTFQDISVSPIPLTYAWNFGNGVTSTVANPPVQTYTNTGTFTAQLTITDTNNCSKSAARNITIGNPTSSFILPDTICINQFVVVQNNSTTGVYLWQLDAGTVTTSYTSFSPSFSFSTGGTHSVTLSTTSPNGQCSDDTTVVIFVEDLESVITSTPTYSCSEPRDIQFNVTPVFAGATYTWEFADNTTSTVVNPLHNYDLNDTAYAYRGERMVETKLIIESNFGCQFNTSIIDTFHLVYARFMPDVVQGCAPVTVIFSDSSYSNEPLVSFAYEYGDGNSNLLLNSNDHSHTFASPGIYKVVMTATNDIGCFDISDTIEIVVGEPIALDFSMDKTEICPGESVVFTNLNVDPRIDSWHYSTDGERLSQCYQDENLTATFDDTVGFFNVTLEGYYNGCLSTITKTDVLEVKGPIAKFNYLYDCDAPLDVLLKNQSMGATSVTWDLGDGQNSASATPFTHSYALKGDYTVQLTATNATSGCPDSHDSFVLPIRVVEAGFVGDSNFCVGAPVSFNTSSSVDVYPYCHSAYLWIYSDPNTRPINTDSPSYPLSFGSPGTQSVTLIVSDINGCTDTLTRVIKVYKTTAQYNLSDDNICLPDDVDFTNLSTADTTIAGWSWSFGDTETSILENPSHTYEPTVATTFDTKLVVTDVLGCADSLSKTITIYKPVSAVTVQQSVNVCAGDDVIFSADDYTAQGSNLIFNWNFDDGTTAGNQTENHPFAVGGTYQTMLYFEEAVSGCRDSILTPIFVQDYPVASYFTSVDALPALCTPQLIDFNSSSTSNSTITSINWDFGGGLTSTIANPTYVFEKGVYTAQLTVSTSFGCESTISNEFTVYGPEGDFVLSKNNICLGEEIVFTLLDTADVNNFQWDFGDGLFAIDANPLGHTYGYIPPAGQTIAKLILYAENGACPVVVTKDIFIHEVRALFDRNNEIDTNICVGEALSLLNYSMNSDIYNWSFGDGTVGANGLGNFTHTYANPATVSIQLIVLNSQYGCTDTLTKDVIVSSLPVVQAVGDTVCYNSEAQLNVLNYDLNLNYSWSPTTGLSDGNVFNPTLTGLTSELYTVSATEPISGCVSTSGDSMIVIMPIDPINFDTTIVIGDSIHLPISNQNGNVLFVWTPEDGLSCLTCSGPVIQPLEEITYMVIMEDVLGCSTADGIFHIAIYPETFVELPTTFTPNDDGANDIIYVKGWGIKELLLFEIYDRWGELVFQSRDLNTGWNGYYKGMLQNNGTYVYKVLVQTYRDEEIEKEGHINLMR